MPDLDRRLRLDVARWRAADAIADVQAAVWVERVFRNVNLFYTSGHIAALATEFMMKQLLICSTTGSRLWCGPRSPRSVFCCGNTGGRIMVRANPSVGG